VRTLDLGKPTWSWITQSLRGSTKKWIVQSCLSNLISLISSENRSRQIELKVSWSRSELGFQFPFSSCEIDSNRTLLKPCILPWFLLSPDGGFLYSLKTPTLDRILEIQIHRFWYESAIAKCLEKIFYKKNLQNRTGMLIRNRKLPFCT